jgi:SAM-dependent methyltransferase
MIPNKASVVQPPAYYDELYYLVSRSYSQDIAVYENILTDSPESRILDLGGGYGRLALRFARLGHDVTVIDRSAEMLGIGQSLMTREPAEIQDHVNWVEASITEPLRALPLNWFRFAICAHHTINELTDGLDGLFSNLGAYLESGGMAIIHALPVVPYERPGVIEYLNGFSGKDGSEWIVSTLMALQENQGFHRLTFFYEQFFDGKMEQRLKRFVDRRLWSREEMIQAASRHGLAPVDERWQDTFMTFSKVEEKPSRNS